MPDGWHGSPSSRLATATLALVDRGRECTITTTAFTEMAVEKHFCVSQDAIAGGHGSVDPPAPLVRAPNDQSATKSE